MLRRIGAFSVAFVLLATQAVAADGVRIKDIGRFLGWRDNPLVGYGLVTGLSGTGDSPQSAVTRQALKNVLSRLGANIPADMLDSRNVAAVMVTSKLPPSARIGDRIDVAVSSIGNARSLAGGTLLMTPLLGPDQQTYALAQGQLVAGGYRFDANFNRQQKNYPTSAVISEGATVEARVKSDLIDKDGSLHFILKDPDFVTANRVADAVNQNYNALVAIVEGAESVRIRPQLGAFNPSVLIARVGALTLEPDQIARIVINERAGTIVAGGGVRISSVVIAQGDVKVTVATQNQSGQVPLIVGRDSSFQGYTIANTKLDVSEDKGEAVVELPNTTVADLVQGMSKAHVGTRAMIAVLQAMKAAGALHAEIVVQ